MIKWYILEEILQLISGSSLKMSEVDHMSQNAVYDQALDCLHTRISIEQNKNAKSTPNTP